MSTAICCSIYDQMENNRNHCHCTGDSHENRRNHDHWYIIHIHCPAWHDCNVFFILQIEERKLIHGSNRTSCIFMVNRPYALVCSAVAFYVPLGLMVLAYQRIYVTAMEHARQIRVLRRAGSTPISSYYSHEHPGSSRMKIETKAAKTLAVIMGCFCLCWAPFFVTNVVDPFIQYSVPWQMWTTWLWLGYINSGLNPFLYAFLNRAFRRAFLMILCCGDMRYARQGSFSPSRPCSASVNGTSIALRYSKTFPEHIVLPKMKDYLVYESFIFYRSPGPCLWVKCRQILFCYA